MDVPVKGSLKFLSSPFSSQSTHSVRQLFGKSHFAHTPSFSTSLIEVPVTADLATILTWGDVELWADGTGRLTVQKGKNQVEPAMVAVTEMTARALRDICRTMSIPQLRCSD